MVSLRSLLLREEKRKRGKEEEIACKVAENAEGGESFSTKTAKVEAASLSLAFPSVLAPSVAKILRPMLYWVMIFLENFAWVWYML